MKTNLIVYGSLLNKNELAMEGIALKDIELVKIQGFKRVFNQEAKRRFVSGINRAVLNIQEDKSSFVNAILIKNLPNSYIQTLDIRELGYDKICFSSKQIISYQGDFFENCIAYVGKEGFQDKTILPNKNYFDICLEGAKSYTKEFFEDYLNTTYENFQGSEITLKERYQNLFD